MSLKNFWAEMGVAELKPSGGSKSESLSEEGTGCGTAVGFDEGGIRERTARKRAAGVSAESRRAAAGLILGVD